MGALTLLVLALYALAELAVASLVASWVGWGWVIVAMAALAVLGVAVQRRAGLAAARALGEGQSPVGAGASVGDASLRFVAGILIAIPGFLTSAVGLLMLVPVVRRVLGAAVVGWFVTRLRRGGMSVIRTTGASGETVTRVVPGDVVEGEVVDERPEPPGPPPALPS